MLLGAMMHRLEHEPDAAVVFEALDDLVLVTEVTALAARFGETPGAYAAAAVARFSSRAADEDWLRLVSALERADDPARALLAVMLRWAMARDAGADLSECGCGGRHDHDE